MANSNSNHWSQSFRPHVVIQDAWEQSQDPETHHEHPASAKAAFVAQAANQANLRQQAQRAIHASWTDQYSHHGLISTDNASQWQQAHMAQQPQQMQQTQQAQQHQHQHQPQYPSGQQYTRQPVTNPPSSLYSSNTSRRAQVLAPNPSRSASGAQFPERDYTNSTLASWKTSNRIPAIRKHWHVYSSPNIFITFIY
ncbi:carbohydrate-binding module family 6 protein [Penicillium atrosanguineum]|uniref:Uncharacterized protein n=1 Tax=Penicillium atrosanguineum TaxID=1132637 RepID=A0A9W9QBH8_9EURO|nr:carbohydrate-binding module family 6 protein [Penicillium atrosanguineum]KAJ5313274.1 carbohydrate-binding module family 6 protein [Penicillium atrosanguineum]KAJ5330370.1 hypothetical protein N7476_000153 [Penicillium atrosanguineum]